VPPTPETRVWFLRHGASTFNLQHRCQGCCDEPELTPRGREGARLSGERLDWEGIQAVVTSPLRRAGETAGELLKAIRAYDRTIAFETDSRLREIELYYWEGMPLEEIRRRFPEQYHDWRLRPKTFRMRLTDTEAQFPVCNLYDRARSLWNDLLTTYAGKSILLVTHGGTIRALVTSALGLGPEHFHSFQQSNCGLSRLRLSPHSSQARLDLLNDTAHLGERLPKLKEGRRGTHLLLVPVDGAEPEAIERLGTALEGVAIDNLLVVSPAARIVASQLFCSAGDSCTVVSALPRDTDVDRLLHHDSGGQLKQIAILGPPLILRSILRQQLRISGSAAESLYLRPLEITSVHRPGNGAPPVLQAMNISKPSPALVGV
jgi:phosphoserine phosphatase